MRRTMHAYVCNIFLEHTAKAVWQPFELDVCCCVLGSIAHTRRSTPDKSNLRPSYLVSLTFSPSGSNEIVIRFTAFKLSNRKFLAIADIKPADRLSDPVCGKDILCPFLLAHNYFIPVLMKFPFCRKIVSRQILYWRTSTTSNTDEKETYRHTHTETQFDLE